MNLLREPVARMGCLCEVCGLCSLLSLVLMGLGCNNWTCVRH